MSRHTLTRTLAAALAVSALAAPTALAMPADPPPAHKAAAKPERVQDLRRLNAGNDVRTSTTPASTSGRGYTPGELRGREAYYSPANRPTAAQPTTPAADTDRAPLLIVLGLAGVCIVLGGAAVAGRGRVRTRRARVAA
jgi:hypothetical protein